MINFLNFLETRLSIKRIIAIGLLLRFFIFITVCFFPIPFGPSPPISPLHYQVGVDLDNYLEAGRTYYMSFDGLNELLKVYFKLFFEGQISQLYVVGPVYPWILIAFDYSPNNTLPLSLLIFVLEVTAFVIWCYIGKNILVGIPGLLFCSMPHSIWFGILISSDIFFYIFTSLFFYFFFVPKELPVRKLFVVCLALTFIRPMGSLFWLALLLIPRKKFSSHKGILLIKGISFLFLLLSLVFYAPYFAAESYNLNAAGKQGVTNSDFSIAMLFFNIITLFGIHPSASQLFLLELLRLLYGMIFVTGYLVILFSDRWLAIVSTCTIIVTALFLLPIWRYLLPFFPLFFIFGIDVINKLLKRVPYSYPKI